MKIFGVSVLTIAFLLGAFWLGRHTGLLKGVPVLG